MRKTLLIILCVLIVSPAMCGLEFDGASSEYINCGEGGGDLDLTTDFTLSAWIKPNTIGASEYTIICKGDRAGTNINYRFALMANNGQFKLASWDGAWHNASLALYYTANVWQHVALTYNGTNIIGYKNGVSASVDYTHTLTTDDYDLYIGTRHSGVVYALFFDGAIDDVRIYNQALSLAEIQTIYHSRGSDNITDGLVGRWLMNENKDGAVASGANTIIDISGSGNDGTPTNSPVYRATPTKLIRRPR